MLLFLMWVLFCCTEWHSQPKQNSKAVIWSWRKKRKSNRCENVLRLWSEFSYSLTLLCSVVNNLAALIFPKVLLFCGRQPHLLYFIKRNQWKWDDHFVVRCFLEVISSLQGHFSSVLFYICAIHYIFCICSSKWRQTCFYVSDTSTPHWAARDTALFAKSCPLASPLDLSASGTAATTTYGTGLWWTGPEFWPKMDCRLSLPHPVFAP